MFKKGINPYPSSKEVLNRNDGNVWVLVGNENEFKMFDTPQPLPTNPMVDPYRGQPKFENAVAANLPFVLLDHVTPWQMAVTKPIASIKQFALRVEEKEWKKFWEACLDVKEAYEERHGTTLYMYTDAEPAMAHFHVNFSPKMPPMPSSSNNNNNNNNAVQVQNTTNMYHQQQQQQQQQQQRVRFAEDTKPAASDTNNGGNGAAAAATTVPATVVKQWTVSEDECAKEFGEVYMVVISVANKHGMPARHIARLLVTMYDGKYDLVHTAWRKDWTPEESVDEYLAKIAYDTPQRGLASFPDVQDTVDLVDKASSSCVRVVVNYTTIPWDTSRSSEKVKWVDLDEFWKLGPCSSVLQAVQKHMKDMVMEYVERLDE